VKAPEQARHARGTPSHRDSGRRRCCVLAARRVCGSRVRRLLETGALSASSAITSPKRERGVSEPAVKCRAVRTPSASAGSCGRSVCLPSTDPALALRARKARPQVWFAGVTRWIGREFLDHCERKEGVAGAMLKRPWCARSAACERRYEPLVRNSHLAPTRHLPNNIR